MMIPEIFPSEMIDNILSDEFFKRFGNPVKMKTDDGYIVLLSFELYERLFGKVDLTKENTVEIDDFAAGNHD